MYFVNSNEWHIKNFEVYFKLQLCVCSIFINDTEEVCFLASFSRFHDRKVFLNLSAALLWRIKGLMQMQQNVWQRFSDVLLPPHALAAGHLWADCPPAETRGRPENFNLFGCAGRRVRVEAERRGWKADHQALWGGGLSTNTVSFLSVNGGFSPSRRNTELSGQTDGCFL